MDKGDPSASGNSQPAAAVVKPKKAKKTKPKPKQKSMPPCQHNPEKVELKKTSRNLNISNELLNAMAVVDQRRSRKAEADRKAEEAAKRSEEAAKQSEEAAKQSEEAAKHAEEEGVKFREAEETFAKLQQALNPPDTASVRPTLWCIPTAEQAQTEEADILELVGHGFSERVARKIYNETGKDKVQAVVTLDHFHQPSQGTSEMKMKTE